MDASDWWTWRQFAAPKKQKWGHSPLSAGPWGESVETYRYNRREPDLVPEDRQRRWPGARRRRDDGGAREYPPGSRGFARSGEARPSTIVAARLDEQKRRPGVRFVRTRGTAYGDHLAYLRAFATGPKRNGGVAGVGLVRHDPPRPTLGTDCTRRRSPIYAEALAELSGRGEPGPQRQTRTRLIDGQPTSGGHSSPKRPRPPRNSESGCAGTSTVNNRGNHLASASRASDCHGVGLIVSWMPRTEPRRAGS